MPILLAGQTASMILMTRYTRTVHVEGPRYKSSCLVLVAELIKLIACLTWVLYKNKFNFIQFKNEINSKIIRKPLETLKVAVPSGIYSLQNNLLFVAISYLDAPTYQITYQLKILTTAVFSVVLMKKQITRRQWFSLMVLMVGVMCVQYPSDDKPASSAGSEDMSQRMIGFVMILLACLTSGFAGVYFEFILKSSPLSLVLRNVQMAFFGVMFSGAAAYYKDGASIAKHGVMQGFNGPVYVVLTLQAFGGLLVASVVQYTDNVVKVFAASLSLIVSSLVSYFVFDDLNLSVLFVTGTCLVLLATFMYGYQPQGSKKGSFLPGKSAKSA